MNEEFWYFLVIFIKKYFKKRELAEEGRNGEGGEMRRPRLPCKRAVYESSS
jgi:hypothetical protein